MSKSNIFRHLESLIALVFCLIHDAFYKPYPWQHYFIISLETRFLVNSCILLRLGVQTEWIFFKPRALQ